MFGRIVRGGLSALKWALCGIGMLAIVVLAMLAVPLERPPELRSISQTVRNVDRSTMPALQRFSARDGTELAYRHYPARGPSSGRIAMDTTREQPIMLRTLLERSAHDLITKVP